MKKLLFLFVFILSSAVSFSQENQAQKNQRTTAAIQHRIDQLICTKEYQKMLERMEKEKLVFISTVVTNNTATSQIGRKDNGNRHKVVYTIRYSVKEDKILSVSGSGV